MNLDLRSPSSKLHLSRRRCQNRQSAVGQRQCRAAFSLTEILVVIGLIVLMIALAVPTFNAITGNRSVDGAQNNVSAFLGRARAEAIGLQETRGVFVYIDPRTGRAAMALVRETEQPTTPDADVYLDLVQDSDIVPLPTGIGVQFVDDRGSLAAPDDCYIGFNNRSSSAADTEARYGGVILFDSRGQLSSRSYAFKVRLTSGGYTPLGRLLYNTLPTASPAAGHQDVVPVNPTANPTKVLKSQFGFVLFEIDPFLAQPGHTLEDLQVVNPGAGYNNSDEQTEEVWLDENALPLLINRYNGTLVRGE